MARAYITTPIYYVNDRPHIGHAYTTTLCDVWARAMRACGDDVFFLTGTDEHGVKVEKSAQDKGVTPQALADENSAEFRRVLATFGLSNDDFIRTTEPRHERQVQALVKRLLDSGDVYLGEFEGWYDEGQEEYVTDTRAKECDYRSPISGKPLVRATERNYYFRLSAYQERLEQFFASHPDFVRPVGRFNEVKGRLREPLQDVPITRTNFTWGIPMPGAPEHVIYVWIDALFNYATALGIADETSDARRAYWPPRYHVIGKEILWFHAVVWPALLMALDLPLPTCVYAHSFWISNGQKMSKSLGNFIDLPTIEQYVATYGLDAWRWYMATQGPLGATDADFVPKHFHEIYTAQLVNTFANCASRTSAMIGKYFEGQLPCAPDGDRPVAVGGEPWSAFVRTASTRTVDAYRDMELGQAAEHGLSIIRAVDASINETQPFKLAKDPANLPEVGRILSCCAQGVRAAAALLFPIMPTTCAGVLASYGGAAPTDLLRDGAWGTLASGTSIVKCAPFMRVASE